MKIGRTRNTFWVFTADGRSVPVTIESEPAAMFALKEHLIAVFKGIDVSEIERQASEDNDGRLSREQIEEIVREHRAERFGT